MKKIKEEIARNFHSEDSNPIPFDYDDNISVSIIATSDGEWMATITVKSNPALSLPGRKFALESEADLYARNQVQAIKTALRNESSIREYVSQVLKNNL